MLTKIVFSDIKNNPLNANLTKLEQNLFINWINTRTSMQIGKMTVFQNFWINLVEAISI